MTEADLARPVVEVRNFETNELEYEIYSYGEENVVIPIGEAQARESPLAALAKQTILREVQKFDRYAGVDISGERAIVRVETDVIPKIIGREGSTVKELEKKLGIAIDIMPKSPTLGKRIEFDLIESGAALIFSIDKRLVGKMANFYSDDHLVFSATVGKKGQIRVAKDSDIGRMALAAYIKKQLKAFV
jgi:ATPase